MILYILSAVLAALAPHCVAFVRQRWHEAKRDLDVIMAETLD